MKNFIETNKKDILLVLLFTLLLLIIYIFIARPYLLEKNKTIQLFTQGKVYMEYKDQKWTQKVLSRGLYKNFVTHEDGKQIGKYNILVSDARLYLKDNKGKFKDFNGSIVAYNSNRNTVVYYYKKDFLTIEDEYVEKAYKKLKINFNGNYSSFYKIIVDADGDGYKEDIYFISNAFDIDRNVNKHDLFSLIFVAKDDKIDIIDYVNFGTSSVNSNYSWDFIASLKFYKDDLIIVRKNPFSLTQTICNEIYKYEKNKYVKKESC